MEISASTVKALRDKTGAGMMDCKKALQESDGDMEKAIEFLRKKGAATAEKRSDRSANEGVVVTNISDGIGAIVEVNCETDFVARSDDFLAFANETLDLIKSENPATIDVLLEAESSGRSMSVALTETIGKIGEKIEIKRFAHFRSTGTLVDYIHPGSKLGVMIELDAPISDVVIRLGKDLAMQVAAMNPVAIDRNSVPKEIQEKELCIYREQAKEQGKPDNMIDRIAEGKLNKYFQEYTLLEQSFIRDSTKTVKEHMTEIAKETGHPISVTRFERFQVGQLN